MWKVNIKQMPCIKTGYLLTFPKKHKYYGYEGYIPKEYVYREGNSRIVILPDCQKIKLKKGNEVKIVTIDDLKRTKYGV